MCELLATLLIAGAVETEPGWMQIEYIKSEQVEAMYIPTAVYQNCNIEPQ